jgi:DnaJ-class molecular chaperone
MSVFKCPECGANIGSKCRGEICVTCGGSGADLRKVTKCSACNGTGVQNWVLVDKND